MYFGDFKELFSSTIGEKYKTWELPGFIHTADILVAINLIKGKVKRCYIASDLMIQDSDFNR